MKEENEKQMAKIKDQILDEKSREKLEIKEEEEQKPKEAGQPKISQMFAR